MHAGKKSQGRAGERSQKCWNFTGGNSTSCYLGGASVQVCRASHSTIRTQRISHKLIITNPAKSPINYKFEDLYYCTSWTSFIWSQTRKGRQNSKFSSDGSPQFGLTVGGGGKHLKKMSANFEFSIQKGTRILLQVWAAPSLQQTRIQLLL